MNKTELRKKYRSVRAQVKNRDSLSEKICDLTLGSDIYARADTVLCYWPVASEVNTGRIILKALNDKKKVALPKCTDKNGNMTFYYINSLSDLKEGMYGIMEPQECNKAEFFSEDSVCIVPGLSFDKAGYRLGYGKGYYDRFLSCFCGKSIGVCFEDCLSTNLPVNEFDKKVDFIITDKTIYTI